MSSFKPSSATSAVSWGFGFEQQMRNADWDQFPRWYRARCLLAPVPQGVVEATSVPYRAAA
jgi:hypothetical protein